MMEDGLIPPPPPDLSGMELGVEFISILAQAQRAAGLNSIDRWVGSMMTVGQAIPEVIDKIHGDNLANVSADRLGVDPNIVVSDEDVAILRDARNKAAAAQEQQMAAAQSAETAKTLSETPMNGGTALDTLTGPGPETP